MTEATKKKISLALKGKMPKNFEEMKKKRLQFPYKPNSGSFKKGSMVGEATWFKKGDIPWLKGLNKFTDERIAKNSGENHHEWKGGITSEMRKERVRFKKYYASKVFERDNYTCRKCGNRGVRLHANHIKSWAEYPELRFELSNVESLCWYCHYTETFKKEPTERSIKFGTWKIK